MGLVLGLVDIWLGISGALAELCAIRTHYFPSSPQIGLEPRMLQAQRILAAHLLSCAFSTYEPRSLNGHFGTTRLRSTSRMLSKAEIDTTQQPVVESIDSTWSKMCDVPYLSAFACIASPELLGLQHHHRTIQAMQPARSAWP